MAVGDYTLYVRLLPPIFLGAMVWAIAQAPYQERANRLLATFLGVVATGFAIEFMWFLVSDASASVAPVLNGVQIILGFVDPPLLLMYALSAQEIGRVKRRWPLWACYGGTGLLLVGAALGPFNAAGVGFSPRFEWYPAASFAFVNGTYTLALLVLLNAYGREDRPFHSRQLFFVTLGVGFAALSRIGALWILVPFRHPSWMDVGYPALPPAVLSLAFLGILYGVVRALGWIEPSRLNHLFAMVAFALGAFFAGLGFVGLLGALWDDSSSLLAYFFSYRWVVFSLLVGLGILRYQLFDFEIKSRQAIALLAAISIGVLAAIGGALLADKGGFGRLEARLLGLGTGFLVGAPLFGLASRLAKRPRTMEPEGVGPRERLIDMYEATLEYTVSKDRWTPEEHRFVETLREVFEVSPQEHEAILARLRQRHPTRERRVPDS